MLHFVLFFYQIVTKFYPSIKSLLSFITILGVPGTKYVHNHEVSSSASISASTFNLCALVLHFHVLQSLLAFKTNPSSNF
jgi:hypothetical protein